MGGKPTPGSEQWPRGGPEGFLWPVFLPPVYSMGNIFSNLFKGLFGKKEMCVHSHGGLGCCRRTTIPYKQKLGEIVATVPNVGFTVETMETMEDKTISLTVWDSGGQDKAPPCGTTASRTHKVSSSQLTEVTESRTSQHHACS